MLPNQFNALIQALSLSQGYFKPCPDSFDSSLEQSSINSSYGAMENSQPSWSQSTSSLEASQQTDWRQPVSSDYMAAQNDDDPCYVEPYDAPTVYNTTFKPFDQARANVFRFRQQQSVNLGSWFVHESWMTPSLFKCASGSQVSELDIASGWGSVASARALLERHWDTFIDQSDFDYLASIGINTVRLPVGYWTLGPAFTAGTPFEAFGDVYRNSWLRVARAINMADTAGIGVLVDLHGAVGSQNGQPHSGISDGAVNLFKDPANIEKTHAVLTFLMQQLGYVTNVVGIQILNEPQGVPGLEDFYSNAITIMRQVSPAGAAFPLYLHNGFDLERFSRYVGSRDDFVVQDHHSYFVFTPSDEVEPAHQHTIDVENSISGDLEKASQEQRRNLVVDEWSCALTPESLANEPNPEGARREFCTGQLEVYTNATAGWSFWAYRKEECDNDPGWCFTAAVGRSLPQTFFPYGQESMNNTIQLRRLADAIGEMTPPSLPDLSSQGMPAPQRRGPLLQRFSSIHARNWMGGVQDMASLLPAQRAMVKGYSDGFMTAKIFAMYGMSRLGFTGQYMENSIRALGPSVIDPSSEEEYKRMFMSGLRDGEAIVSKSV